MLSLCGHEMRFSIALEGTHTKLAITLYQIDVHRPLCDGDVKQARGGTIKGAHIISANAENKLEVVNR